MDIHAKLASLGLKLPAAPKPVAAYVPAVRAGQLIFVSGQIPRAGEQLITGTIPSKIDIDTGKQAARICVLNGLAAVDAQLHGDWSQFDRVVRVGVFVASDDSFTDQPKVADGASELLVQIFGDAGRHARAAVGVNTLPLGVSVEVELTVQVR